MENITVNIITTVGAVVGSLIGTLGVIYGKSRKDAVKDAQREQAQSDKMDKILDEQQKMKIQLKEHNGYAEKFADTSKDIAVIKEKQIYFNKAIDGIQKDIDYLKSDRCRV